MPKNFFKVFQWLTQLSKTENSNSIVDIIDVRTTYKPKKGFLDTTLPGFRIIKVLHVNSGRISDVVRKENFNVSDEDFLISQGFSIRYTQFDKRRPSVRVIWERFPWEIENRVDIIDLYQQAHIGTATRNLVIKYVIEYVEVKRLYEIREKEIFGKRWDNENVQDYLAEQKMFVRNYHPLVTKFPNTPLIKFDESIPRGCIVYDSRFPEKSYK